MRSTMRAVVKLAAAMMVAIGFVAVASWAETGYRVALPGCPETCGNVTVPYPFGIGEKCSCKKGAFNLTCDSDSRLWTNWTSGVQITAIDYVNGQMQVLMPVSRICYNESGSEEIFENYRVPNMFTISPEENKFFAVGCDASASFLGLTDHGIFLTRCRPKCDRAPEKKESGNCAGRGCCQATIPVFGLREFKLGVKSLGFGKKVGEFKNCTYVFVARKGWYHFIPEDLTHLRFGWAPMAVDWDVGHGNQTCESAVAGEGYVCEKSSTECVETTFDLGYHCRCKDGFHGNPYLPSGCQRHTKLRIN
ncbi:unnamed protein product [Cuscuta europaea]|uniref:Wall-associated receptor kinase galacturonan-binding domain-containing protein n=1 Tax=Cuscuta europaea TaxID=41803 RepID=A0A9P0YXH8_CUSEU|nr:unnamed protein product [Cuscuta europaea]